jgi:hypothetical protein
MKMSQKVQAGLQRRIKDYENLPSGNGGKLGPSDNKNQIAHRPGSQNRKKGYGMSRGSR